MRDFSVLKVLSDDLESVNFKETLYQISKNSIRSLKDAYIFFLTNRFIRLRNLMSRLDCFDNFLQFLD